MKIIKLSTVILLTILQAFGKRRQSNPSPTDSLKWYQARRKPPSLSPKANIILMMTDDQDKDLGSLMFMPKLAKYLGEEGASFQHGYASTPMCCPSRSSMLTGLYVHNHHVFTNNDNCSSPYWMENHEKRTFATYLHQNGYKTAYFGKYLNKYNGNQVPPGWDTWFGLVRNSRFYNYTINNNGVKEHHGYNYARDYLPDLITNKTLQLITNSTKSSSPFLAVLSFPGPHGPEDAAPPYQDMFLNVTTHHTPAYDFAPNPDKQWILRHTEKMLPIHRSFTDMLMTKRLQTLQSVDSAVEKIVQRLEETGQLSNTYIFYTSDHGYHLGQFGLVKGKAFPFDFDTHIPFLVRGPGINPGSVRNQPVLNIDLAPTFLDIAGLEKPPFMDGKSILPTFISPETKLRDAFLIERGKMTHERYAIVSQEKKLSVQERLSVECRKSRYQLPCSQDQKWACMNSQNGSLKIKRCQSNREFTGTRQTSSSCQCNTGKFSGVRRNSGIYKKSILKNNAKLKMFERFDRSLYREIRSLSDGENLKLQSLSNSTDMHGGCSLSSNKGECRNKMQSSTWVTSRSTIKHKIQQLRAQLNELKQIRKYLRIRRPSKEMQETRRHIKSGGSSFDMIDREDCGCASKHLETRHERRKKFQHEKQIRKKQRKLKAEKKVKRNGHCKTDVQMNCFSHDDNHWQSAPLWTEGPFCACTNSNNNTYWCVRNVNNTHNYLYCEYVTGMITYFDLLTDPHQLSNTLHTLPDSQLSFLHQQLIQLKNYSGEKMFLQKQQRLRRLHLEKLRRNTRRHRIMKRN